MEETVYEYKNEGKTLVSLFFLIVSIAAVVLGANSGAPIYWYIPIGFAVLFGAWWFMNNPKHACRLTEDALQLWSSKATSMVKLTDVITVEIKEWMDGPDDISLVINDGTKIPVSYLQYGNAQEFIEALQSVGLKLNRK